MKGKFFFSVCILCQTTFFNLKTEAQTYSIFKDSYGMLFTVAGKGMIDDKSVNGWSEIYEGGKATEAELSRPHMAMADTLGNIFIADKDAHAIRKVDVNGIITTVAGTGVAGDNGDGHGKESQLSAPNGLWVTENGTLYILDLNNNKIRKLDNNGQMITLVHDTGSISVGRGLCVNVHEDTIFYASGTMVKRWASKTGIDTFATGFVEIGNIIPDPNGFLVVTDRGGNLVNRLSKDGAQKEVIAGNGSIVGGGNGEPAVETALYGVRGVWFLADGSYFLATHEGSQVWHVDTDGVIHLFLNGIKNDDAHYGDGMDYQVPGFKISEVRAVTIDHRGNVLITENDRGFIRMIEKKQETNGMDANHDDSFSDLITFPNPAKEILNVSLAHNGTGPFIIRIINQQGQLVKKEYHESTGKTHNIRLYIGDLPKGFYILQFSTNEEMKTTKINIF